MVKDRSNSERERERETCCHHYIGYSFWPAAKGLIYKYKYKYIYIYAPSHKIWNLLPPLHEPIFLIKSFIVVEQCLELKLA